MKLASYHSYSI